jgi:hypothetical protein
MELLLDCLLGPACLLKLTLEEGIPLNNTLNIFMSPGVLHLPCPGQLRLQHKHICAPPGQML